MPRPKRTPSKPEGQSRPLSARQDQFCREYLLDLNATKAAIRAGYAPTSAPQHASKLLTDARIEARIEALRKERNERLNMTADDVVKALVSIVKADPRKLTKLCVGPCRYCWGIDHAYQWRTLREYEDAQRKAEERQSKHMPTMEGGFGYNVTHKPNADCPECNGLGHRYTLFTPTDEIDGPEAVLFQGVKETRDGLQFVMADKGKALERLADHLGIYDKRDENAANAFTDMVKQLLRAGGAHTRAPIRKDPTPGETP